MNNFDQSSTGVNLELSCIYDTYMSRIDFDDNFTREDDQLLYTDFGQCGKNFEKNYTQDITVKDYFKLICKELYFNDVKDCFSDLHYSYGKLKECSIQDLNDFVWDMYQCNNSYDEFMEENFTPEFDVLISTGYCQGDYQEVIIPMDYWKVHGIERTEKRLKDLSDHIDNLLWDCPVCCRLEIDGEEYFLDEYLDNIYDYDKNLIVEKFKKDLQHDKKDLIIDWLADNLPDYPDYH